MNYDYHCSFPFHINGDMAARMMAILGEMAPGLEIYSIDESFLDVSGISSYMPLEDFGLQMRNRVKKEIGLTIGVGFGPSKTLTKLANFAAKKWTQTGGTFNLTSPERQRKLLALVSVDDIWGIGGRLSKRLHTMGISTALQLADSNISMIRKSFDVIVERTVRELNGESCLALESARRQSSRLL
ncbi:Y-family DNA polymerase [Pantoea agglomerans]|uniref:Y-family DNA polymerase n=1 Tax=Enterobacter agglomerans TaxID=549 RepID=UPI0035DF2251